MPKSSPGLSVARVRNAKPNPKGMRELPDGVVPGLRLRVGPSGKKWYEVRLRAQDKRIRRTVGTHPTTGLKEARERAEEYRAAVQEGITPDELDRRKQAKVTTFADAHAKYMVFMADKLNARYYHNKRRMYEQHIAHVLGSKPLTEIRRADLQQLVEDAKRRGLTTHANRILKEAQACLRWCAEFEYIESVPMVGKHSRVKETPRDRTLTDTELAELWNGLDQLYPLPRDFIALLVLTGQRRDDIRLMHASEIDTSERLLVIPPERYKTEKAQVVPLEGSVWRIIERLLDQNPNGYLLPGRDTNQRPYKGPRSAMDQLRRVVPSANDYTLHDLRRTVRTGLRRIGVAEDVAEAVLGHAPGGIKGVYDRYERLDEKRDALARWADYVSRQSAK